MKRPPCAHRGRPASCCEALHECGAPGGKTCVPTVDAFVQLRAKYPVVTQPEFEGRVRVCAECDQYQESPQ